jgi:DNA-binding response OmpR family regulator
MTKRNGNGNGRLGHALVIEDELIIGRMFMKVLADEGFDVDFAPNGLVAVEKVKKVDYQFCLADIKLPGMNGIEFYNYLEAEQPEMLRRVVFTTGDLLTTAIREFLCTGDKNFIAKPFMPSELIAKIREVISSQSNLPKVTA